LKIYRVLFFSLIALNFHFSAAQDDDDDASPTLQGVATKNGALLFNNADNDYFTFEIQGKNLKPFQKDGHSFININGKLIQFMAAPFSDYLTAEDIKSRNDSLILQKQMKFESANFEKVMKTTLTVEQKTKKLAHGRIALVWSFKMPKQYDKVTDQLFFSTVTKNHVLLLNGVITQKSDYKELSTIMQKALESLVIKDKPIEADDFKDSTEKTKSKDKDD
jgi:hypothetical protein